MKNLKATSVGCYPSSNGVMPATGYIRLQGADGKDVDSLEMKHHVSKTGEDDVYIANGDGFALVQGDDSQGIANAVMSIQNTPDLVNFLSGIEPFTEVAKDGADKDTLQFQELFNMTVAKAKAEKTQ